MLACLTAGRSVPDKLSLKMYTTKINCRIRKVSDADKQQNAVNLLLGSWRGNGQILGEQFLIAKRKGSYTIIVNVPEKDSLSLKFDNKYTAEYRKTLCTTGLSKPITKILGKEPESAKICQCRTPKYYILYTNYLSLETPLRCGDCFGVVPLYRIPKTYDDEYHDIIIWQSDYQACDSLQMNCIVGEKFGLNQMFNINSMLTKSGMEVCSSIRKVTKKKTYYYLCHGIGKSYNKEISRRCPSCNGKWHQKEPIHNIFDFMCKKCGLLSNIAWNIQRPGNAKKVN